LSARTEPESAGRGVTVPIPERWLLENGLTVLHLPIRNTSIVTTALCYRAGAAKEMPCVAGTAHFLEHLMFKGCAGYGPGAIDRETHRVGGWNNAFTSHDSTLYLFGFATDHWRLALAIEASRMRSLDLRPAEVAKERSVVLEEIAMYEDDPWDSLELAVNESFFGTCPYGRSILGTRESVRRIDEMTLREFHSAHYGPENAVLAVAGDVERAAVEDAVDGHFRSIPRRQREAAPPTGVGEQSIQHRRIDRRQGDTGRFLLAMGAPAADDPAYAPLDVALTVLAGGRASRLQRRLVEELRVCSRVSAGLSEMTSPASSSISAEMMPDARPDVVERTVVEEIERLRIEPPSGDEMSRARSMLLADWVFGHQRIHQQAVSAASAEALFDPAYPATHLRRLEECSPEQVVASVRAHLAPATDSVVGWSLPAAGRVGAKEPAGRVAVNECGIESS